MPLLFVIGLPIGLAKKQNARCVLEAVVIYVTFNYFLSAVLQFWGPAFGVDYGAEVGGTSGLAMICGIKSLDTVSYTNLATKTATSIFAASR